MAEARPKRLIVTVVGPSGLVFAHAPRIAAHALHDPPGPAVYMRGGRALAAEAAGAQSGAERVIYDSPPFHGQVAGVRAELAEVFDNHPVDWCVQPAADRRKRVLVCDMDSTVIDCECVDELAVEAGAGAAVAQITAQAMAGALDFAEALTARVALLEGLPLATIEKVYAEKVRLNPGVRALTATMAAHGGVCALVSGGFTAFTERVASAAGFHEHYANTLEVADGRLSGGVAPPILGAEAKKAALEALAARAGVTMARCIAVGDGANDLAMVDAAGLGVAYRAKPVLKAAADAVIQSGDHRAALYFQGYTPRAVVEPA